MAEKEREREGGESLLAADSYQFKQTSFTVSFSFKTKLWVDTKSAGQHLNSGCPVAGTELQLIQELVFP